MRLHLALGAVGAALLCLTSAPALAPAAAGAAPEPARTLIPGRGATLTMAKCSLCHDIMHVTRTRLSRDEWDDNIRVMIERGMPIEPQEIVIILDYLATYYNRDKPPPPPDPDAERIAGGALPVEKLLSAQGCTACHTTQQKLVGPSFSEIAARYRGEKDAPAHLARKIREGGAGVWGAVPMPPNPNLAASDLERIAAWVLKQ